MIPEILTASKFYLELKLEGSQDGVDGVFMECKGFQSTQEVIEFKEVFPEKWNKAARGLIVSTKIPGNLKVNNIILKRGLISSKTLWNWFDKVQTGSWHNPKQSGILSIYNQGGKMQAQFEFINAWPTRYSISDLNASSNDFAIEELELACESFKRIQ